MLGSIGHYFSKTYSAVETASTCSLSLSACQIHASTKFQRIWLKEKSSAMCPIWANRPSDIAAASVRTLDRPWWWKLGVQPTFGLLASLGYVE